MQLMRALFALGHRFEELLRRILGMACHESDEKLAGDVVYHADKVGKINAQTEILAVGVDVLPEQGNVLAAGSDKLARLGDDILRAA